MTPPVSAYAQRTLDAYAAYASAAAANWATFDTPSAFLRRFAALLPRGARVLDYGCGIGTDLAWLAQQGCRVEGLDGTRAFVREARRRCPRAVIRQARFEDAALSAGAYDGIWCNAALIHVPPEELRRQLTKLRQALIPVGWLGLTLAWGRTRAFTQNDWIPGRYFAAYSKEEARAFLDDWRVDELRIGSDAGRPGRWLHFLAQRHHRVLA